MTTFARDLRLALRGYLRRPAFTAVVVLTLALGIGATTAIFSVVKGVVLAPLPFPEADRLMWLVGTWEQGNQEGTSPPDFHYFREQSRSFEQLAATTTFEPPYNLTGGDRPELLQGRMASAGLFSTLGVRPVLGREFSRDEETPGGAKVVMLSHELWTGRFGADSALVGSSIMLHGGPHTVVGVLPPGFDLLGKTDVWTPMRLNFPTLRRVRMLQMVGRLRDGVTIEAAQQEMSAIARQLEETYPQTNQTWGIRLVPLTEQILGPFRVAMYVLFGAVIGVLLIACVNVANLVLSRAMARETEFAVQAALGASRGRLIRMLLTESLLLSIAGGIVGSVLAVGSVKLLKAFAPPTIPRLGEIGVDAGVLLFAFTASLVTGLLFGIKPALRASRTDLSAALKAGGRSSTGTSRFRSALVVGQVAMTLVLLVGAALLSQSLWRLSNVNPGFRTDHLLVTRMSIPAAKYSDPERKAGFWRDVTAAVEAIPGVMSAGLVTELPLSEQDNPTAFTAVTPGGDSLVINVRGVSPDYLATMGVPLRSGRHLSADDRAGGRQVLVINESMARAFFPEQDPIGHVFTFDFGQMPYTAEVIGVTGDIRHSSLAAEPFREAYLPVEQTPLSTYNLVVHTAVEPMSLVGAVRDAVWAVDADQPMAEFRSIDTIVSESLGQPRFRSILLASFAALGLLLSMVGLYGVVNYLATQRTREIGIRMAIGARDVDILRMVLKKGITLTALGLALGIGAAVVATRVLASLLFGVEALDLTSFVATSLVLLLVAGLASYLPAWRASRTDPAQALRYE